jgi:3-oxoacyl-[acyl-carrier protein] reductase
MNDGLKAAVVTGGARGIGREIAARLVAGGYGVVVADLLEDQARATASELSSDGTAISVAADVSSADGASAIIASTMDKFGRVDVLVNNAGITRDGLLMRMDESVWDAVLAVNLKGAFLCTKAAARHMFKQRYGRIVNISSVVGVSGNAGQANYAASKAGLIGFTKSCAKEFAARGITVNAVAPGYVATEMTESLPEEVKAAFLKDVPLGRPGTPVDVAEAVAFFVLDAASYVTGQVLHVDGGMIM